MFPAGRTGKEPVAGEIHHQDEEDEDEAITKKLRSVLNKLKPRRVIPEGNSTQFENQIPRPGTGYKSYRSEDDLPDTARTFYDAVARLAGLSLSTLVRVVALTENKIRKLEGKSSGGQVGGSDSEGEQVAGEDLMDIEMGD
jgi:RNA polymerase I-specific transcription initiation factor RRN7